jgi:hypothetical protein
MITNITGSEYIQVSGGGSTPPFISTSAIGAGMMRWNPNMNCIEVSDGVSWKQIVPSYPAIDLTPDVKNLLEWARAQRTMYMRRLEAAQKNPALLKALEAIKRAEENFELLDSISKDYKEEIL